MKQSTSVISSKQPNRMYLTLFSGILSLVMN